jgi:hypothetical protein
MRHGPPHQGSWLSNSPKLLRVRNQMALAALAAAVCVLAGLVRTLHEDGAVDGARTRRSINVARSRQQSSQDVKLTLSCTHASLVDGLSNTSQLDGRRGCSVEENVRLMPAHGVRVMSAYISLQIICRGQRGIDQSLGVSVEAYGDSMQNASSCSLLSTAGNGVDMTRCQGQCTSAGFVLVVNRHELVKSNSSSNLRSVRVTAWSILTKDPAASHQGLGPASAVLPHGRAAGRRGETKVSDPETCSDSEQENLIVLLRVQSDFWHDNTTNKKISLILAIAWIPFAVTMLFCYLNYHKRTLMNQVQAPDVRLRVCALARMHACGSLDWKNGPRPTTPQHNLDTTSWPAKLNPIKRTLNPKKLHRTLNPKQCPMLTQLNFLASQLLVYY